MKKFDYRLARERVKLATDIVKLATRLIYFGIAVLTFLSMAFNYLISSGYQIASSQMDR